MPEQLQADQPDTGATGATAGHSTPPSPQQLRSGVRTLLSMVVRAPATLGFTIGFWVLGALSRSLLSGPRDEILNNFGASVRSLERLHFYTFLTSAGWTTGLVQYLLATVSLLAVGAVVERQWGTVRFLWVGLLCQFFGTAVGLLVVEALRWTGNDWATGLALQHAVGPWPMVIGLLMAYSRT